MLLFTDGLFEVFNRDKEEFGTDRIKSLIESSINLDIPELIDLIVTKMKEFTGGMDLDDDITCLGISYI
ncbi:MAG: SpoIIE family protein phosphatase [Leptospiraceae bacterium]|nr:SpoIIE family protein phosphatase [Leptospiraceae bacterium]